ncbi:hypothetical protein GCM10027081_35630 [Cupriavidus yeoncheonensis]
MRRVIPSEAGERRSRPAEGCTRFVHARALGGGRAVATTPPAATACGQGRRASQAFADSCPALAAGGGPIAVHAPARRRRIGLDEGLSLTLILLPQASFYSHKVSFANLRFIYGTK